MDIRDKAQYPELKPFDIVINNAGVQNEEDIDVNLRGTIGITEKYGIHPNIRAVLMIGSASGHNGSEFPEYVASKGGVLSYTKNVALRIAKYGATCNSLDFGGVLTELNKPVMEDKVLWNETMEQTPLKRWMTVEETADWAYFMTVTNRFCTGQNILIDGLEAGNAHFVWPEKLIRNDTELVLYITEIIKYKRNGYPGRNIRVFLFPGIGYHCDKPLLYYGKKLAIMHEYTDCISLSYSYDGKNIRGNSRNQ